MTKLILYLIGAVRWWSTGMSPDADARHHSSTRRRTAAQTLAVAVTTVFWTVVVWTLSRKLFGCSIFEASGAAGAGGFFAALVQRCVLACPPVWHVVLSKVILSLCLAFLGADLFDSVIFASEVAEQIRAERIQDVKRQFRPDLVRAQRHEQDAKNRLDRAQEAKLCEARNCDGHTIPGAGRTTHYLENQEHLAAAEYQKVADEVAAVMQAQRKAQDEISALPALTITANSGLLQRMAALRAYLAGHPAGRQSWWEFFGVTLSVELLPLLTLLSFRGKTVDDYIQQAREIRAESAVRSVINAECNHMHWLTEQRNEAKTAAVSRPHPILPHPAGRA